MKSIKITRITKCNLSERVPAEMLAQVNKYPHESSIPKDIIKIEIDGSICYFYATPEVEIELLVS